MIGSSLVSFVVGIFLFIAFVFVLVLALYLGLTFLALVVARVAEHFGRDEGER